MSHNTVVRDIYATLQNREAAEGVDVDAVINTFGEECKEFMRDAIGEEQQRSGNLRLSALGKPNRKLWHDFMGTTSEPIDGPTYIKFLYGHLTETMVLALTELAGHKVTEKQKVCEVEGIKGRQDCRIDGMLVDVKSASSFGFKKFKYNTLHKDDQFGYIAQLKAYAHQEGDTKYAWLAMDKANGSLAWLEYDEEDTSTNYHAAVSYSIVERAKEVKKLVGGLIPSVCYEPVPDGKSGNMKLQSGCGYCGFRSECWPDVQVYFYANGPRYLTEVVREPNVLNIPKEF